MKTTQPKPTDEMKMSSAVFDRIMGQALQIKPEETQKPKRSTKVKTLKKPATKK